MDLADFFQIGPVTGMEMKGTYNLYLVALSYFIACLASFVALDLTERIRTSDEEYRSRVGWLIAGAFAMGIGIWTMHFIGMLAFIMPMPMNYDPIRTGLSLVIAIIASGFAFFLIRNDKVRRSSLIIGGVLMGLGIASMHYIGMWAMLGVKITYIPSIFLLSIAIAIIASEAALWLMITSTKITKSYQFLMKIGSSLVMGLAICGMHYTGMEAAVFVDSKNVLEHLNGQNAINLESLSYYIAGASIVIISIALAASRFWMNALQLRNKKLMETEAILEQKSLELEKANQSLSQLAENSLAREERISAILKAAADGIVVTDSEGNVEICNQAAQEILGTNIISSNFASFIFKKGSEKELNPVPFSSLMEKNEVPEFTILNNEQEVPIELNVSKSFIKNKINFIFVFRNISERKIAEENLFLLNNQLVQTARFAGMAEVASGVLHNVGNVLNSINVSSKILLERHHKCRITGLNKLSESITQHKNDLESFLKEDPVGQMIPEYLKEFANYWNEEERFLKKELDALNSKVDHVRSIVNMQQSLSISDTVIEQTQVNKLVEDALAINSEMIEKNGVIVECQYEKIPDFEINKAKTLQSLVNVIKNAIEAVVENRGKEKKLILRTKQINPNYVCIEVSDNGIGIKPEDLTKIFTYGYTTKKAGHGFGLHSSALSVQQTGGSLRAYSPGPNQGSTFIITLPKKIRNI